MLILPDGYKPFNERIRQYERKSAKDTTFATPREDGFKVDGKAQVKAIAEKLRYSLPLSFCAACGRTDIDVKTDFDKDNPRGALGLMTLEEPHPEIDLKPGDVVHYGRCGDCQDGDIWSGPKKIWVPRGWRALEFTTRLLIQDRMIEFIKQRRLSGVVGVELGD